MERLLQYAVCLDLSFEEDTYAAEREQALSSHHFLEAPIESSMHEIDHDYEMPIAQKMIGGYDVRIVDEKPHVGGMNETEYLTWFPYSFGFLAFQDEKMNIRYCYIYNPFGYSCDEKFFIKYLKLNFPVNWK